MMDHAKLKGLALNLFDDFIVPQWVRLMGVLGLFLLHTLMVYAIFHDAVRYTWFPYRGTSPTRLLKSLDYAVEEYRDQRRRAMPPMIQMLKTGRLHDPATD